MSRVAGHQVKITDCLLTGGESHEIRAIFVSIRDLGSKERNPAKPAQLHLPYAASMSWSWQSGFRDKVRGARRAFGVGRYPGLRQSDWKHLGYGSRRARSCDYGSDRPSAEH